MQSFDNLGPVKIAGDLVGGAGDTSGWLTSGRTIASLTVGGSLRSGSGPGSCTIEAYRNFGAVLVKGSIVGSNTNAVVIAAVGFQNLAPATTDLAIKSLTVKGRVEFADILAGYTFLNSMAHPVNADAQIGTVVVGGDWIASNLLAGAVLSLDDDAAFGTPDDDALITDMNGNAATITARIGSVVIKGQALGTPDYLSTTDYYGLVAQQVGSLKVAGTVIPLHAGANNDHNVLIGVTGDFELQEGFPLI